MIHSFRSGLDRLGLRYRLCSTWSGGRRRSSDQFRQAPKVLRNGSERELILSTAWSTQPKATSSQNALEMCK